MPSRKLFGLIAGPALYFIVAFLDPPQALDPASMRVIATACWMITWWVLEVLPLPATALLPIVLFPLGNVFSVAQATAPYASSVIFLFLGGFIIAAALEKHNLHKRIALSLIKMTGTHSNGIILGFMIATAVLSMWISNTATAVMMLPIAMSVINLLAATHPAGHEDKAFKMFSLSLFLGIAYAANIGGTATIIGTPPNVVLVGFLKQFEDFDLEFSTWLLLGIPLAIMMIAITYLLLTRVLYPNRLGRIEGADAIIQQHLTKLGPFTKEERIVTTIFVITALGWVFKNFINDLIGSDLLSDTVTAMAGGILMFLTPTNIKRNTFVLDWDDTTRLPWGILLLFGGGMSLAKGMEATGLVQWIGNLIASNSNIDPLVLVLILTGSMLYMTELMSNIALATIYLPVVIGIANGMGMDPVQLAIPVAIASSYAFMMPISTPPNAIVFASGHIKMRQMMRAGFLLNILAILLLLLASQTLIKWIYS